jgi:hypothetical protein
MVLKRILTTTLFAFGICQTALAQAPATKVSGEADRKQVTITVYNQNFGLVREVRELKELGTGRVALEFRDVASTIQPETVAVKPLAGGFSVLEQNYRFDLLSPETLLRKYVGQNVRAYRYHEATGKEDMVDAKLLSIEGGGPVLQIGKEITFGYPGRFAFPEVPPNLIAKPTLVWLVDSKQPKQSVEVSYLAQGLSWKTDYVFVVNDTDTKGDIVGWVTLVNHSGSSYKNAELKLVAGDVNRVREQEMDMPMRAMKAAPTAGAVAFREEGLFEYHLYTLSRPTTVLDKEQKQVTLLEAQNLGVRKRLIFFGQQYWFRGQYGELPKNQKVSVYLDFENAEKNGLGMPLPKGVVRVYKADKSGAKQFVGEDSIDHTPRDERVRVKMGEAFDVVADRKQLEWKALGSCVSESAWQIELRNHKDENVKVEIREPAGGDWTVVESSHPATREDATTFTFDVPVAKRGKTQVKYRVRVRWC